MTIRRIIFGATLCAATIALPWSAALGADGDIKRLAPADAYMAVYARSNPERAYQQEYIEQAWQTFEDERIAQRIFDIISRRAPEEDLAKFKSAWAEIETALEPINIEAMNNAEELVVSSLMIGPIGHTLFAVRLTEEDAEDYREGVGQLFEVFQKWSEGKVTAETTDASGTKITYLRLPSEVPIQPVVASVGDLFIFCTSDAILQRSLAQLADASAKSKFDDERLVAALKNLPEAEDALTFFDAKQLFASLRGIGDFIRQEADDEDQEHVERGIAILDRVINEVAIIDYEAAVEYTAEGQNRVAAIGQVSANAENTILGRAVAGGEPFENWQSWVPADAASYSLSTGINLHELYVGIIALVRELAPESHSTLDEWEAMQDKVGVHVDEDILQAFTGENVSITFGDAQSVSALRCSNETKVRELLDRAIEGLNRIPALAAYQISLEDSDDEALEGFQLVKASVLQMTGAQPVIGFHDGWMIMASSPDAAKKLLAVRAGEAPSVEGAASFERFNLKVDGEVYAVSYSDIGAGIRAAADGIEQFAMMAPMMMAPAMAEVGEEDRKLINELLGLLPSFAKVIRKFDFFEQSLTIVREGPMENTYLRETVTLVRQPEEAAADQSASR